MFGDNESVVNSSSTPHAKLHKRHNALSFHRVREAIAAKIIGFYYIPSELNCADVLSKHWGWMQVRQLIRPLMLWRGETSDILKERSKTGSALSVAIEPINHEGEPVPGPV